MIDATGVGLPLPLRAAAAWGLSKIDDPRASYALEALTLPSQPRDLRLAGLDGLAAQRDSARAAAVATQYLDDPDPRFAAAAVRDLAKTGGAKGRARLQSVGSKESRTAVKAAIENALRGP